MSLLWMQPVVKKGPWLGALFGSSESHASWTRREKGGPVFDVREQRILAGGSDSVLHVLSIDKATTVANISLPGNLLSQPLIRGEHIYFGLDQGAVLSLRRNDYAQVWITQLDSEIEDSIIEQDGILLAVTGLSTIYAIDAANGQIKWLRKRPQPATTMLLRTQSRPSVFSMPESNEKIIACGHPAGRLQFFNLATGESISKLPDVVIGNPKEPFPDIAADPIVINGNIISAAFNTGIIALDSRQNRLWTIHQYGVSRLQVNGSLIFAAGAKFVMCIQAATGKMLWRFTFNRGAPSRMLISDGKLYVSSDRNGIFILDIRNGQLLQTLGSVLGVAGDMFSIDNYLFAIGTAGQLFAYSTKFRNIYHREKKRVSFPN